MSDVWLYWLAMLAPVAFFILKGLSQIKIVRDDPKEKLKIENDKLEKEKHEIERYQGYSKILKELFCSIPDHKVKIVLSRGEDLNVDAYIWIYNYELKILPIGTLGFSWEEATSCLLNYENTNDKMPYYFKHVDLTKIYDLSIKTINIKKINYFYLRRFVPELR